jgi:predicted unusual protein kinase regulating ubiquinone biosynthesis (AarF/ABC1/UbiB family)
MQAPKTPYEMVKNIVEKELGKPLEEVYDCKTLTIAIFNFYCI